MPAIEGLVFAGAGRATHNFIQMVGRGTRLQEGKDRLEVFDMYDTHCRTLFRQSRIRLKAYKAEPGFNVEVI